MTILRTAKLCFPKANPYALPAQTTKALAVSIPKVDVLKRKRVGEFGHVRLCWMTTVSEEQPRKSLFVKNFGRVNTSTDCQAKNA